MADAQLTIVYSNDLWATALDTIDRDSIISVRGAYNGNADIKHVDDKWFVTRTFPRLDPMTGAPIPVSFLLQIHGSSPQGIFDKITTGQMEIRFSGPDAVPLWHVLDIHCIAAESTEKFFESGRSIVTSLRSQDYPDIPVVFALTSGRGVVPVEGRPTIIQAWVKDFLVKKGQTVKNF